MTGEAAELYFMARAAALGLIVSKPLQVNAPYDAVIETSKGLLRIQVKSASFEKRNGWYGFLALRQGRSANRKYKRNEIDFVAGYVAPWDAWYIVPITNIRGISICVHPETGGGKYERFRERWDLFQLPVAGRQLEKQQRKGRRGRKGQSGRNGRRKM